MIRLILVGILLLLSFSFFLQNQEQEVTFRYLFGMKTASAKVYMPVLSAFVVGLLVASILLLPAWVQGRIEEEDGEFLIGIGKAAHAKHSLQADDLVRGLSEAVVDRRREPVV